MIPEPQLRVQPQADTGYRQTEITIVMIGHDAWLIGYDQRE